MKNSEFSKFYLNEYLHTLKTQSIGVETTFRCPLQCPFCERQDPNYSEMIKTGKDIPIEDFEKLCKSNHRAINLCGQISDPIYHLEFLDLLKIASKYKDKEFRIHTTATRKKIDWWEKAFSISKDNLIWIIGLDGTDQETANKYRVNTIFDEVIDVLTLAGKMKVNCVWQFIVFQHNEHQIAQAKTIAKTLGIKFRISKSNRWDEKDMNKYQIFPPSKKYQSNTHRVIYIYS